MRPFAYSDYIDLDDQRYMYLNDDDPMRAYETDNLCFVAQPLSGAEGNKKYNVVPVPLMMTDEWDILQKHPNLVEELRETEKVYDYMFIGQCHYMGREAFRYLELPNYYFVANPQGVFHLSKEEKQTEIVKFLRKIAQAKFVFAPRGMGSSSFRLYQSFMAGSVPIVTGMNDYPFSEQVDWDTMCLRGKLHDLPALIKQSKSLDYQTYCDNGKKFWDNYCRHDRLHERLLSYVKSNY